MSGLSYYFVGFFFLIFLLVMYIDSINFPSMTYLSILLMVSFDEQKIESLLWLILSVLRPEIFFYLKNHVFYNLQETYLSYISHLDLWQTCKGYKVPFTSRRSRFIYPIWVFSWHSTIYWKRPSILQGYSPSTFLPGKSHGRRSLVGCSPWGC